MSGIKPTCLGDYGNLELQKSKQMTLIQCETQKTDLELALKVPSDENFLYRYCQLINDNSLGEPWSDLSPKEKMLRATIAPRSRSEEVVIELADIVANRKARINKRKQQIRMAPKGSGVDICRGRSIE